MSTQTKGQHTPGPWGLYGNPQRIVEPVRGAFEAAPGLTVGSVHNTEPICRVSGYMHDVEANARLIAAAPDLLAALERTYRLLMGWAPTVAFKSEIQDHLPYGMDEAAKAFLLDREIPVAIAKARGEA